MFWYVVLMLSSPYGPQRRLSATTAFIGSAATGKAQNTTETRMDAGSELIVVDAGPPETQDPGSLATGYLDADGHQEIVATVLLASRRAGRGGAGPGRAK
jgi:hypothetical protein